MIPQHFKLSVREITQHCSNFHEAVEDIIAHILNLDTGKENRKHLGHDGVCVCSWGAFCRQQGLWDKVTNHKVGELFASGLSLHFNDIFCIFTTKTCMLLLSTFCIRGALFLFHTNATVICRGTFSRDV